MSSITKREIGLLSRIIKKHFRRHYIPLVSPTSNISIGDILETKQDYVPIIDGSVFGDTTIKFVEGDKINENFTSSSSIELSFKAKGSATLSDHFDINEAGLAVKFSAANEMFLKVKNLRQRSILDFTILRQAVIDKYVNGAFSSKVFVVRGVVYADKFYLQYSGQKGGEIAFNIDADVSTVDADIAADFSAKWKKSVGYHIDGHEGGVLGYRVSGIRLKRHKMPEDVHRRILSGVSEEDALNNLSFSDRKSLLEGDALELTDCTDEIITNLELA